MSTLALSIPAPDLDEFATWPEPCRVEVRNTLRVIHSIEAARGALHVVQCGAASLGLSVQRMRAILTAWRNGAFKCGRRYDAGDWRVLVNRAKYDPVARRLPVSFLDFWRELLNGHQRDQSGRAAHDALLARLRAWEGGDEAQRIPGYRTPPPRDLFSEVPAGWTYANLMRHKPTIYQDRAARQGLAAASAFRLPILKTRIGLEVGQVLQFDDQDYDTFVNFLGVSHRRLRPLGLDCIDFASAGYVQNGYKPTLVEIDRATGRETRRKLKESDAMWFVAHVLCRFGYRADLGTVLTGEHGTMSIPEEFIERIFNATGGKVRWEASGIIDNRAHAAMHEGKGGGNFKRKALLEGARVLLRNRMAALPGATGLSPEMAPEDAYAGAERHNQALLDLLPILSPAAQRALALPVLEWNQFTRTADEIYRLIDARTRHEIEGFVENGWTTLDWRPSQRLPDQSPYPWLSEDALLQMPLAERAAINALITQPGYSRTRVLSPGEVRNRAIAAGQLTALRGSGLVILLDGLGLGREMTVGKDLLFHVSDEDDLGPSELHFQAVLKGTRERLQRGEKYLCYLNPFGAQQIEVCDARGAWLGTCEEWDRLSEVEVERIEHRCGQAAAVEAEELRDVRRWAAPAVVRRADAARQNATVIAAARESAGFGTTTPRPAERRRAKSAAAPTTAPAARHARAEAAAIARARTAESTL